MLNLETTKVLFHHALKIGGCQKAVEVVVIRAAAARANQCEKDVSECAEVLASAANSCGGHKAIIDMIHCACGLLANRKPAVAAVRDDLSASVALSS